MSDSVPDRSQLRVEAIGPQTRPDPDGTVHRRVLITVTGMLVLTLDDAASFASQVLAAVRAAERA